MVLVPLETTVWTAKILALPSFPTRRVSACMYIKCARLRPCFLDMLAFVSRYLCVCVCVCVIKAEIERESVRQSNRLGCGKGILCQLNVSCFA